MPLASVPTCWPPTRPARFLQKPRLRHVGSPLDKSVRMSELVICPFCVTSSCRPTAPRARGGQPSRYLLCKGAAAVDHTRRQRQLVVWPSSVICRGTTGRGVGGGQFYRTSIVLAWSDLPWPLAWFLALDEVRIVNRKNETKRAVEFGSVLGQGGITGPTCPKGPAVPARIREWVPYSV